MFWDKAAWVYDLFANGINRKANRTLCAAVEKLILPTDEVLECACGTGLLTGVIAPKCRSLTATDFSANMLKRAEKKCGRYGNVRFERADILHLAYPDARFDAVVAANVIHLLDEPYSVHNETISRFRRMMTIEQFRSPELAKLYTRRYVDRVLDYHAGIFRALIAAGEIRMGDPDTLAMLYVAPVLALLGICDRQPEREDECLEKLRQHVRLFFRMVHGEGESR